MSIAALAAAEQLEVGDPLAKFVLCILAQYADDEWIALPSIATIERITELSRSSIIRKLDYLENKHLLRRVKHRAPEGDWDHNRYTLLFRGGVTQTLPGGVTQTLGSVTQTLGGGVTQTPNSGSVPGSPSGLGLLDVTPIPPDWTPDPADIDWAQRRHPTVELAHETERFRDHFLSCGFLRRSWPACFREWVRRADRPRPASQSARGDGQLGAGRPRGGAPARDAVNRERLARARRELSGDQADGSELDP